MLGWFSEFLARWWSAFHLGRHVLCTAHNTSLGLFSQLCQLVALPEPRGVGINIRSVKHSNGFTQEILERGALCNRANLNGVYSLPLGLFPRVPTTALNHPHSGNSVQVRPNINISK